MLKAKVRKEEPIVSTLRAGVERARNKEIDKVIEMGNWDYTYVPTDPAGIPLNGFEIDFLQEKYIDEYIIDGKDPILWADAVRLDREFVDHLRVFFIDNSYSYEQQQQFFRDHDLLWKEWIDGNGLYAFLDNPVFYIQVPN